MSRAVSQETAVRASPRSPLAAHVATPSELARQLEAMRGRFPFLVYRDGDDRQCIVILEEETERIAIGRRALAGIALDWDRAVSRLHAEIERIAGEWTVADDGLSQNGTFVNGERIQGRRRLRDGDELRFGGTIVAFRNPAERDSITTLAPEGAEAPPELTPSQRRVLIALSRPYTAAAGFPAPASNRQIAEELFLSVDAVKSTLRMLFRKFGLVDLSQNEKRAALVRHAYQTGVVTEADLRTPPG